MENGEDPILHKETKFFCYKRRGECGRSEIIKKYIYTTKDSYYKKFKKLCDLRKRVTD